MRSTVADIVYITLNTVIFNISNPLLFIFPSVLSFILFFLVKSFLNAVSLDGLYFPGAVAACFRHMTRS